jgi:hypothetical protein
MKKTTLYFFIVVLLAACANNKENTPDVSGIKVDLKIERFDKDFFNLDTNNLVEGLQRLEANYPAFYNDYMQGILGVNGAANDLSTQKMTRVILNNYAPVYAAATQELSDFSTIEKDLKKGFQFVKYYFPQYRIPGIITFMGTFDAPGMALTERYIGIGLHQYAGKNFEGYKSEQLRQLYPAYISRRFESQYIPANVMKAVVTDLFPDKSATKPLIEQMIEKGKQWWLLDKFLPGEPDSVKTGYTKQQLDWCRQNEGLMWSYMLKNEDLYSITPSTIQIYIGEAPFTQAFSQELSPGNIGQWIGWQIVRKFAENNPNLKPEDVMQTPAKKVLEESKYKPK